MTVKLLRKVNDHNVKEHVLEGLFHFRKWLAKYYGNLFLKYTKTMFHPSECYADEAAQAKGRVV